MGWPGAYCCGWLALKLERHNLLGFQFSKIEAHSHSPLRMLDWLDSIDCSEQWYLICKALLNSGTILAGALFRRARVPSAGPLSTCCIASAALKTRQHLLLVCSAGWWVFVDASLCAHRHPPFVEYLPGIVATLALLMINCLTKDDLGDSDGYEESLCRWVWF
jgi:hypothetical protein